MRWPTRDSTDTQATVRATIRCKCFCCLQAQPNLWLRYARWLGATEQQFIEHVPLRLFAGWLSRGTRRGGVSAPLWSLGGGEFLPPLENVSRGGPRLEWECARSHGRVCGGCHAIAKLAEPRAAPCPQSGPHAALELRRAPFHISRVGSASWHPPNPHWRSRMFPARIHLFSLLGFRISIDISWFFLAFYLVLTLTTSVFPERFRTWGCAPISPWLSLGRLACSSPLFCTSWRMRWWRAASACRLAGLRCSYSGAWPSFARSRRHRARNSGLPSPAPSQASSLLGLVSARERAWKPQA